MNIPFFISCLASKVKSSVAQRSFLKANGNNFALLENKNLDRNLWFELFKGSKVQVAIALTILELDEEMISQVVKDKRKTVHESLLTSKNRTFSPKNVREIIDAKWFDQHFAGLWLRSKTVPRDFIKEVALINSGSPMILSLTDRELFTPDEAVSALLSRRTNNKVAIPILFDNRPELIDLLINCKDRYVLDAIAQSQHLLESKDFEILFKSASALEYHEKDVHGSLLYNPHLPYSMGMKIFEKLGNSYSSSLDRSIIAYGRRVFMDRVNLFGDKEIITGKPLLEIDDDKVISFVTNLLYSRDFNKYPTLKGSKYDRYSSTIRPEVAPREIIPLDYESIILSSRDFSPLSLTPEVVDDVESKIEPLGEVGWDLFWVLAKSHDGNMNDLISQVSLLQR